MKKVLSILLAMVMVLSMTTAAFAAKPQVTETASPKVTGLQDSTTSVSAYKVLSATINNDGTVTYALEDWARTVLVGTGTGQYADEATALSNLGVQLGEQINNLSSTSQNQKNAALSMLAKASTKPAPSDTQSHTKGNGVWDAIFAPLDAGSYLVIATDSELVYNPMMVSVGFPADDDGNLENAIASDCVAKYSPVPFDKYITSTNGGEAPVGDGQHRGGDLQVGDVVEYTITATVPDFDAATYTNFQYKITDTLDNGLTPSKDWNVNITGFTGIVPNVTYAGQTAVLDLSSIAGDISGKDITIVYHATLNKDAVVGFDGNVNTAKLEYGNDPTDMASRTPIEKKTYDYTFSIDGNVIGNNAYVDYLVKKTGEGTWETTPNDPIVSEYSALAGAKFGIYYDLACTNAVPAAALVGNNEVLSTADGRIKFEGLDAGKEYYIKEISAPTGYTRNTNVYGFKFEATYATDGQLTSYKGYVLNPGATDWSLSVTYTKDSTSSTGVTAVWTSKGQTTTGGTTIETTEIKNTKLINLPSTGGMGTTLFTVAGCLIMIAAAGMFFVSRRKEER